jgi:hypothetical protein
MSFAEVLRLDEHRDKRTYRLRLAEALYRIDPRKRAVFGHLTEVVDLTGADRAATVWVDEYGTELVHPHVLLDQLQDRPRRGFSVEPLREAWHLGVPSAHDRPPQPRAAIPTTFAVALGSDGARAWFLVAESVAPRPALDADVRDRVMFLAGECAGILLHRDLDLLVAAGSQAAAATRFAGWPILEDLEGRESNVGESRRIARRFVVGRLVRKLVDDDLASVPDRMAEQVRRARAELGAEEGTSVAEAESDTWHRVLDALDGMELETLARELVAMAEGAEAQGHDHGAIELYRCAYDTAASLVASQPAMDAARLMGRLLRRRAEWTLANDWFQATREIADVTGQHKMAARALVGLAGIKKEMGNLPAARGGFREALVEAERSGDRDTMALVHHGLLGLEQVAGNVAKGLEHGWIAVETYESHEGRVRCLASLAGALADYGDREAAEDAWGVVALSSSERYYRIYAHDALGHLAALRGDAAAFELHASTCDGLDWESGPKAAKAEILYYRGLSHLVLGNDGLARQWLERAVAFAEEHGFNRVLFLAEAAVRERSEVAPSGATPAPAAPRELREGLRAMRQELAEVTA